VLCLYAYLACMLVTRVSNFNGHRRAIGICLYLKERKKENFAFGLTVTLTLTLKTFLAVPSVTDITPPVTYKDMSCEICVNGQRTHSGPDTVQTKKTYTYCLWPRRTHKSSSLSITFAVVCIEMLITEVLRMRWV